MIKNFIFEENLSHIGKKNNFTLYAFHNIWYIRAGYLLNNKVLRRYIKSTCDNWDNYNENDKWLFNITSDYNPENEAKDPNKFYCINNWLLDVSTF